MSENPANLDVEFKRYLQIMRPYLGQLMDQDVIDVCNAWVQRLSLCKEVEKPLRNKYVFALCYQLAKGILNEPFLTAPTEEDLRTIDNELDSDDCTTEVEYVVVSTDQPSTKVIYDNKRTIVSETDFLSQDNDFDDLKEDVARSRVKKKFSDKTITHKENVTCYTCPKILQKGHSSTSQVSDAINLPVEKYEYRATNLIMKLREIKNQNILLQNELLALKQESGVKSDYDNFYEPLKTDFATSISLQVDSNGTIKSLKQRLSDEKQNTQFLIEKLEDLQRQLEHVNDIKRRDIADFMAENETYKAKICEESQKREAEYKKEIKQEYEMKISNLKCTHDLELENLKKKYEEQLQEKQKTIDLKEAELSVLKAQMGDQNLKTLLGKLLERPSENLNAESEKIKAQELEKRLLKMERAKAKSAKVYEAKLAFLQREKHLTECSLQVQLVRQRAQVVNEISDESQTEIGAALEKLEGKYKELVANVQTTAIQRRMQDQAALEAILHAACGTSSDLLTRNHLSPNTVTKRDRERPVASNERQSLHRETTHGGYTDTDIPGLLRTQFTKELTNLNRSLDSESPGFCLDSELLGELFDKVYIPQRDTNDCAGKGHH